MFIELSDSALLLNTQYLVYANNNKEIGLSTGNTLKLKDRDYQCLLNAIAAEEHRNEVFASRK